MSGSGGADEIYGACLTFFMRSDYIHAVDSSVGASFSNESANEFQPEYTEHDWWEAVNVSEPDRREKIIWSGVCLCMLTRGPYLEQLCRTLLFMYLTEIAEPLSDWEQDIAVKIQLGDTRELKPLVLGCTNTLVALCLECPLPLSGYFSVQLQFPEYNFSHDLASKSLVSIYPEKSPDPRFIESIVNEGISLCTSTSEQLPDVQFDVAHFFHLLGPRVALDCIAFALAECKVLFHSRNVSKLPIICESIRALIYPFKWSHVFVPVIPAVLLDLVQAPVPFILGIHTSRLQFIAYDFLKDVIVINCDTGSIDRSRLSSKVASFPSDIDRWLMLASKMILYPSICFEDSATAPLCSGNQRGMGPVSASQQLQVLIFDMMMGILRHVPSCLFFVNKRTPVFNRPLFMSKFASSESSAFLDVITNSNSFHQFIAGINSNTLQLFMKCSEVDPVFFSGKSSMNTPSSTSPPSRKASLGILQRDVSSPNFTQNLVGHSSLNSIGTIGRRRSLKVEQDRVTRPLPAWIVGDNWNHDFSSLRNIFAYRLQMYLFLNKEVQNDLFVNEVVTKDVPCLIFKIKSKSVNGLSSASVCDDDSLHRPPSIRLSVSKPANRPTSKSQYGIQGSINRRESIKESLSRSRSNDTNRKNSARRMPYERDNSLNKSLRTISSDSGTESVKIGDETQPAELHEEASPFKIPLPAVVLDAFELIGAAHEMKTWTAKDIAVQIKMAEEVIANQLTRGSVARYSSLTTVASRAQTSFNFGLESGSSQLDDRIVFFLQQAFSADTAFERDIDSALFGCAAALHDAKQRLALVDILSQSESSAESKQGKTALKLFPVHETLFNALHRLSNTLVQCCASQDDFLAAYKLLQVGGKYCCALTNPEVPGSPAENEDNTQFLSDLIRHQPIYQNTSLWAAVMQSRLPLGSESTDALMNEVHSLLHEMHGIGVNFDRALLFIQSIADDYRMDVEKYFDLQRFMADIWIVGDESLESDRENAEPTFDVERFNLASIKEGQFSSDTQDSYISHRFESVDEEDAVPRTNARRRSTFFREEDPDDVMEHTNVADEQSFSAEAGNSESKIDSANNRRRRSIFEVSPNDLLDEKPPSPQALSRAASIDKPRPLMPKSNSPLLAAGRKTLERQELEKPGLLREQMTSRQGSSTKQDFGQERNNSGHSEDSSNSQSPNMQLRSSSPPRMPLDPYLEDSQDDESLDLTFEHSSDLLSFARGLSKGSLTSPRQSYFSSFFSSFGSSILPSSPMESPSVSRNKSPVRSPVQSLTKGSANALRANKRSESESVNIPSVGRAIAEVYEELLLLDKAGKVRKGGTVTTLHSSSNWLVTGSEGGIVELIDMKLGQQVAAVMHKEPIAVVRCLDNASGFVSACRGGVVKVWKMPRPSIPEESNADTLRKSWFSMSSATSVNPQDKRIAVIKGHANPITALVSEGGFDGGDGAYWQIATGDISGEISVYRGSSRGLEFNSAEMRKEGKSKRAKLNGVGGVSCLSMMTSGKLTKLRRTGAESSLASDLVAVGSKNGAFAILDISTGHWIFRQTEAHGAKVNCIDPLSGREVFTASNDRTVKLWDVRQRCDYIFVGHFI